MKARRISFLIAAVFGLAIGKADVADSKILSLPDGLQKETQQLSDVKRTVTPTDEGVRVTYSIADILVETSNAAKSLYTYMLPDFSISSNPDAPALPGHADSFEVPAGYDAEITLTSSDWTDLKGDVPYGLPLLVESSDKIYTADDYEKAITSGFSPVEIVTKGDMQNYRGHNIVYVGVNPVQYDSSTSTVRVFHSFTYEVKYVPSVMTLSDEGSSEREYYETGTEMEDASFLQSTLTYALPYDEPMAAGVVPPKLWVAPTYLILTTPQYKEEVEKLAAWRRLTGYNVDIAYKNNWTSQGIKEYVYNLKNPPYALLLFGSNLTLPGIKKTHTAADDGKNYTYVTDLYYSCWGSMDETDYTPDMYLGRIPVENRKLILGTDTMDMNGGKSDIVDRIINYERYPPTNSSYYDNVAACAYFQDVNKDGWEDNIETKTMEQIATYLQQHNKKVNRIYRAEDNVNPIAFDGFYGLMTLIPDYLRRPDFAWNGSYLDIYQMLEDGTSLVMYRGHGTNNSWGNLGFSSDDLKKHEFKNGFPLLLSITCLTGDHTNLRCFVTDMLNKKDRGALGTIAATTISYTYFNDTFIKSIINCFWPTPWLNTSVIPLVKDSITIKRPITTLGAVVKHSLYRNRLYWYDYYKETEHKDECLQRLLFNEETYQYFGDPLMRFYTEKPLLSSLSVNIRNKTTLEVSTNTYSDIIFVNNKTNAVRVAKNVKSAEYTVSDANDLKYISYTVWTDGKRPNVHEGAQYIEGKTLNSQSEIKHFSISGTDLTVECNVPEKSDMASLSLSPVMGSHDNRIITVTDADNVTTFENVKNGIYVLTLSVDGEIVDTKKIIKN